MDISSGAFLDLRGNSVTVDALSGARTVADSYGHGTNSLTLGVNNGSASFSGSFIQAADTSGQGPPPVPQVGVVKIGTGRKRWAAELRIQARQRSVQARLPSPALCSAARSP